MQKLLLIIAYGLNILIAVFGNYAVSYLSEIPFYEKTVEMLFFVTFLGLLDGARPVAVSYGASEKFDFGVYKKIVELNNRFSIVSLTFVVLISLTIGFLSILDKAFIIISIYPLLLSSVFLGLIDSKGMYGSAAFVRTIAWSILFLLLIILAVDDNVTFIYSSLPLYSISQLLISYSLFKKYVTIPISVNEIFFDKKLKANFIDSYKTNIFRSVVDFSDRIVLFLMTPASFRSGYLSRMDLAQKYVNAAQLISLYIYPKLCILPSNEERINYFKKIFFPILFFLYFIIFFVLLYSNAILNFYFNGKLVEYNYLFNIFIVSLLFNFQSFLFVPLLRSCGDFSTPKNTFLITGALIFASVTVIVCILDFNPDFIAYAFLFSKIGYMYNNVQAFKLVFKNWLLVIPLALLVTIVNYSFLFL